MKAKTEFEEVKKFSVISQFKRKKKEHLMVQLMKAVPGWIYPHGVSFPSGSPSPSHRPWGTGKAGERDRIAEWVPMGRRTVGVARLGRPRANKQVGDFGWQQI